MPLLEITSFLQLKNCCTRAACCSQGRVPGSHVVQRCLHAREGSKSQSTAPKALARLLQAKQPGTQPSPASRVPGGARAQPLVWGRQRGAGFGAAREGTQSCVRPPRLRITEGCAYQASSLLAKCKHAPQGNNRAKNLDEGALREKKKKIKKRKTSNKHRREQLANRFPKKISC